MRAQLVLCCLVAGCSNSTKNSEPPVCPPRLAETFLGTNFFADVFTTTGLSGAYARRVTFGDVNGDRYPDFVSIATGVQRGLQHLYLNTAGTNGRTFVDATASSGITMNRGGTDGQVANMMAFGDVDGDGDLDLFSGSYSQVPESNDPLYIADPNELYINDGAGVFTLKQDSAVNLPWPLTTVAATFLDYDKDGQLDLFVGNFMVEYRTTYDTNNYQNNLYHGAGDGTFTLANTAAGIVTAQPYGDASGNYAKATYGVTACDWNNDGWPDLLASSYALGWNDLWKNDGDGTFTMASMTSGFYMDDEDNPQEAAYRDGGNSFAVACGDYDNDGDLDLMTAETAHGDFPRSTADRSRLLVNTGAERSYYLARPDLAVTGINRDVNGSGENGEYGNEGDHGVSWLDFDNDGLLDLVIEQSAYPNSHAWLFHQLPGHGFENVTPQSGVQALMVNSNGLSVDDYDRDGDLDILMGSVNTGSQQAPGGVEQIHLYENRIGNQKHYLYVTLHGITANRQGIGARVVAKVGCIAQTREISGGKGTFGAADPAYAHFGLGDSAAVDSLEITWPTNPPKVQTFSNVPANRFVEVTEDSPTLACVGGAC